MIAVLIRCGTSKAEGHPQVNLIGRERLVELTGGKICIEGNIQIGDMYRGVMPFIALQVVTLAITLAWPGVVTWLPGVMLQLR